MSPSPRERLATHYPRAARVLVAILFIASLLATGQGQAPAPTPAQPAAPVPAARQAANIAIITIEGEIRTTTLDSVQRRLTLAERAGADAIVIEIDSPGGDLGATLGISKAIKSSPIKNTVAWVHDEAYSGGAIIALAAREIVVSDPASMGDALPILAGGAVSFDSLPEHERQKVMAPLISDLVDSARRNNYDEVLLQGIATRGVELWLIEHTQTGQRLFVTRDEYRVIFGEEPTAATPTLASAPAGEEQPAAAEEQDAAQEKKRNRRFPPLQFPGRPPTSPRESSPPVSTIPPPDPNNPNRYIPATPGMDAISGEVTLLQDLPTERPRITPELRGQFRVVEYVATGSGPFVFQTREMLRYNLAAAVVQNDEELKAFFGAKNIIRLDPSWSEGLVTFLTLWPVKGVLVVLFLLGLFIEMVNPGMILPGAVAACALVGLIAPPMLIDMASWWELAAILVGIVFILIELFVIPGMGFVGIIGLVLLFGGLIGAVMPAGVFFPDSARQQNDLLYGVTTLVVSIASAGVLMYFIARNFSSLPFFGHLVLKPAHPDETPGGDPLLAAMSRPASTLKIGTVGRTLTTLRPAGQMEVDGAIYDVVAEIGYIAPGESVKVVSLSPFRIGVEPA